MLVNAVLAHADGLPRLVLFDGSKQKSRFSEALLALLAQGEVSDALRERLEKAGGIPPGLLEWRPFGDSIEVFSLADDDAVANAALPFVKGTALVVGVAADSDAPIDLVPWVDVYRASAAKPAIRAMLTGTTQEHASSASHATSARAVPTFASSAFK